MAPKGQPGNQGGSLATMGRVILATISKAPPILSASTRPCHAYVLTSLQSAHITTDSGLLSTTLDLQNTHAHASGSAHFLGRVTR